MPVRVRADHPAASSGDSLATVLARLPREAGRPPQWHVFADVPRPGRGKVRIDLVLVGPQGVFVVDTQEIFGEVGVRRGVLLRNGRRHPRATVSAMRSAKTVSALLAPLEARSVVPVVCVTSSSPVVGRAGSVLVCSAGNLVDEVTSGPVVLSPAAVHRVASVLGPMPLPLVALRPSRCGHDKCAHDICQQSAAGSSPDR